MGLEITYYVNGVLCVGRARWFCVPTDTGHGDMWSIMVKSGEEFAMTDEIKRGLE
jgi:hypothetical protein